MMLAPKPYPADVGVCRNPGRNPITEYMPPPNRNATRLFVHTARERIIFMSTKGLRDLSSAVIHANTRTAATATRPSTRTDPQPQLGASLTATSRAINHPDSKMALIQLM